MADALTAFLFAGGMSLAWQTYSDLKHKEVDSRRNWFMFGAVFCIVMMTNATFWFYLLAIILTVIFTGRIKKMFADGDLEALQWVIPGFTVLSWKLGLAYLAAFALCTGVYLIARKLFKINGNTAGYTIITGAFIITAAIAWGI